MGRSIDRNQSMFRAERRSNLLPRVASSPSEEKWVIRGDFQKDYNRV